MNNATLWDEILFVFLAPLVITFFHIKIALCTFFVLLGLLIYKRPVVIFLLLLLFTKKKRQT